MLGRRAPAVPAIGDRGAVGRRGWPGHRAFRRTPVLRRAMPGHDAGAADVASPVSTRDLQIPIETHSNKQYCCSNKITPTTIHVVTYHAGSSTVCQRQQYSARIIVSTRKLQSLIYLRKAREIRPPRPSDNPAAQCGNDWPPTRIGRLLGSPCRPRAPRPQKRELVLVKCLTVTPAAADMGRSCVAPVAHLPRSEIAA